MANYNNAIYISEAMESVLSQTYQNWEIIIVDDCSGDDSLDVIRPYLKDSRIKLFANKKNEGCGSAKRTAAKNASGEVIGILDPDDVLDKNALKIMAIEHINNPDHGLIYSSYWVCDKNLTVDYKSKKPGNKTTEKGHLIKPHASHFMTFKKEAYDLTEGIDRKQIRAVDKDIIYKLEEVTKIKFIDQPLYYYRWHGKGISQGNHVETARIYDILAKYKAYRRRKETDISNLTEEEMQKYLSEAIDYIHERKEL